MKVLSKNRKITLFFIAGANRSIVRTRISKWLIYSLLTAIILVISFAGYWLYQAKKSDIRHLHLLSSRLHLEQQQAHTLAKSKDQTIEDLQDSLIRLSEQSKQVQAKLTQIEQQQAELQKLADPDDDLAAADMAQSQTAPLAGVGGVYQPLNEENTSLAVKQITGSYQHLNQQMEQISQQITTLRKQLELQEQRRRVTPSIWPVHSNTITSGFGLRHDPFGGQPDFHNGIDIGARTGDPVHTTADGVVQYVGTDESRGKHVKIDHGGGLVTIYMHLSKILVNRGDHVRKGQEIGRVGSTGRSTGPHLHYEILKHGDPVNPMDYLPAK